MVQPKKKLKHLKPASTFNLVESKPVSEFIYVTWDEDLTINFLLVPTWLSSKLWFDQSSRLLWLGGNGQSEPLHGLYK